MWKRALMGAVLAGCGSSAPICVEGAVSCSNGTPVCVFGELHYAGSGDECVLVGFLPGAAGAPMCDADGVAICPEGTTPYCLTDDDRRNARNDCE